MEQANAEMTATIASQPEKRLDDGYQLVAMRTLMTVALLAQTPKFDQRANRQSGTDAEGVPNDGLFHGGYDTDELLADSPREEKHNCKNGEARDSGSYHLLRHPC